MSQIMKSAVLIKAHAILMIAHGHIIKLNAHAEPLLTRPDSTLQVWHKKANDLTLLMPWKVFQFTSGGEILFLR